MNKYYLTFGANHNNDHPGLAALFASRIHDGFIVIEAEDYASARMFAFAIFSDEWAFLRAEEDWDPSFFPLGELAARAAARAAEAVSREAREAQVGFAIELLEQIQSREHKKAKAQTQGAHMCVKCGLIQVDAHAGFDTCEACMPR